MSWDAYPSWTLKDAVPVARELERLGVFWMEEPLHRGDVEGMRRLRDKVDIRIAGGEMTRELYEFRTIIAEGALDVLQPDAALVGASRGCAVSPIWPRSTTSPSRPTPGRTALASLPMRI